MRLITILGVILAATIALSIWSNRSLAASAQELSGKVESIAGAVSRQDWQQAEKQMAALEKTWNKKKNWWPALMDHQEIDNIESSIARTREYITAREIGLSRGEISQLKLMINHIPEKEKLNLKNIL